jgi:hypothetical protein
MVAMNTCAGLGGQVLGRVRHYKMLPMLGLLLSIGGILSLAWRADAMTMLSFQLTLVLIGAGFGPLPSVTAVAIQNVVPRHQLGIAVGSMNFSRNLLATMLIAVFGAIVLAGAAGALSGELATDTGGAAEAFRRVFFAAAASMSVALVGLATMEERPLKASGDEDP